MQITGWLWSAAEKTVRMHLLCYLLSALERYSSTNYRGFNTLMPRNPDTCNKCLSPLTIILLLLASAQARNLSSSGSLQTGSRKLLTENISALTVTNSSVGPRSIPGNCSSKDSPTLRYSSSISGDITNCHLPSRHPLRIS